MNKTTSQVLQEARALVEAGWCQGPYSTRIDRQVCYCVSGAVQRAIRIRRTTRKDHSRCLVAQMDLVLAVLDAAAIQVTHGRFDSAIAYNEEPGRTKQQVLALFDRALTDVTK